MPARETAVQRAARRTRFLLRRVGEELRVARMATGMSARTVGALVGISHSEVLRIERALAPHVGLEILARLAAIVGHELSLGVHPVGAPVRDKAHVALLERFAARLHPALRWRTEVPLPLEGDLRSCDGRIDGTGIATVVEAETRIDDVQAVQRKARAKQRDARVPRLILLVADTRHNREVIRDVPDLRREFPISTRACLAALARGDDPGGDCLVIV